MISIGSMQKVIGSISTNTGVAPVRATEFAVAAKVKEGTITSSPLPIPSESNAICKAEVPELTATHSRSSTNLENSFSKLLTSEPWASNPERITRSTALRSALPISGFATGIIFIY